MPVYDSSTKVRLDFVSVTHYERSRAVLLCVSCSDAQRFLGRVSDGANMSKYGFLIGLVGRDHAEIWSWVAANRSRCILRYTASLGGFELLERVPLAMYQLLKDDAMCIKDCAIRSLPSS
jgi:hypothetical protein